MKKGLKCLITFLMTMTCAGCSQTNNETESLYTAGVYSGKGNGRNGDVIVEVEVSENEITAITVTEHEESAGIADPAITGIPERVIEAQSTDIDVVAGATITSDAILEAIDEALSKAKGETANQEEINTQADVIVLGAGGAGLAAGAGAAEEGASVIILEANNYAGGATLSSGAHMVYVDDEFNAKQPRNDQDLQKYLEYDPTDFGEWSEELTTLQTQVNEYLNNGKETGRFDSVERVLVDHYVNGRGTDIEGNEVTLDYQLTKASVEANMDIYNWLVEDGMTIKDSLYKDHANSPVGGGAGLVDPLVKKVERLGCEIHYSTRAIEFVVEDGVITGVVAEKDGETITYTANKGVVIATGGFASNGEMVAKYQKYGTGLTANVGSTNPKTNIGDGIIMAESVNAKTLDMQFITTVLMGYHSGSSLAEAGQILGTQQLVVNALGERFVDESNNSKVQKAMNNQPDGLGYLIGDVKMIDALNEKQEGFVDDLVNRGWVVQAESLEEAAQLIGLDSATVKTTVDNFNKAVDEGDIEFNRTTFNGKVETGPYLIAKMEMHYHLTFGGLVVDGNMQVLDVNDQPIENLYAAGDVLSGFEGDVHQSGDCLSVVVYSGQQAGKNASK